MIDRKARILKMLEKQPNDAFLLYGLAMEHKNASELEEAIAALEKTISADAGYCYAYYQLGQIRNEQGDTTAARQAYERGLKAAKEKGDAHAASEISTAMDELPE